MSPTSAYHSRETNTVVPRYDAVPIAVPYKGRSVKCSLCGKKASRKNDFEARHKILHASNFDELKMPCRFPDCKFKALQKTNLDTHERSHLELKDQICPEPGCDKSFSDPAALCRHRQKRHGYLPNNKKVNSSGDLDAIVESFGKAPTRKKGKSRSSPQATRHEPYRLRAATNRRTKKVSSCGGNTRAARNGISSTNIHLTDSDDTDVDEYSSTYSSTYFTPSPMIPASPASSSSSFESCFEGSATVWNPIPTIRRSHVMSVAELTAPSSHDWYWNEYHSSKKNSEAAFRSPHPYFYAPGLGA